MKIKFLLLTFISFFSVFSEAGVSVLSRANCYVPLADIGWESITWGWPQSNRSTASWHLKIGDHSSNAHRILDDFRVTWRSFAGDSHGYTAMRNQEYEVRGLHYWAHESIPHVWYYAQTVARDCNWTQW